MTCDKHGAVIYEPPYSPKENYTCPQCEIDELREELEALTVEVASLHDHFMSLGQGLATVATALLAYAHNPR